MQNLIKGCVFGHIDKFRKGHDGQIKKNACKNAYLGSIFILEKYLIRVLFVCPWTSLIPPLAIRVAPPGLGTVLGRRDTGYHLGVKESGYNLKVAPIHFNNFCILNVWGTNLLGAFCPFWEKCLKPRHSVKSNGEFQTHMQFSLSKSNVRIYRLAPTRECLNVS